MLVFNDIQTKVINLIISHHQLSKNQLAILAELSRPTVSKVVNQLLEQGLLVEVQHNKKMYCQLNAEFDHVITVEINASYIRIGLFDFSLNLKDNHTISTYSYADRSQLLDALCQEIACFMASKTLFSDELNKYSCYSGS